MKNASLAILFIFAINCGSKKPWGYTKTIQGTYSNVVVEKFYPEIILNVGKRVPKNDSYSELLKDELGRVKEIRDFVSGKLKGHTTHYYDICEGPIGFIEYSDGFLYQVGIVESTGAWKHVYWKEKAKKIYEENSIINPVVELEKLRDKKTGCLKFSILLEY